MIKDRLMERQNETENRYTKANYRYTRPIYYKTQPTLNLFRGVTHTLIYGQYTVNHCKKCSIRTKRGCLQCRTTSVLGSIHFMSLH